ncbi:MAG: glycosyltransferase, partial [Thermodesulfobacteriota bacterium]
MGTPKVSVVIPAYNHERYVGEAIESVLGQTFEDFELIIINDGSTDRTEDEILKFNDRRIRYYSQENRGLSATLNRGIELSRGEYFTFLPSDDVMLPEKLEVQLKVMEESKEIGIVFSYPIIIDGEGKEVLDDPIVDWFKTPFEKKEEIFPALFERNFLCAPTALIRQECFTKVGFFDEFLKTAQDYDMWMRILKYYDLKIIKTPLLKLRWHGANLTYRATEGTEMERAKVLMKAYRNLSLEEIFPNLKKLDVVAYYQACLRLSDYMENAGLPSLIPVAILYREMGEKFLKESQSSLKCVSLENRITTPLETFLRNKINILIETPSLDRGGMENVIFDFSKSLDKDLFKVVIVCVERGGELVQKCKEMGIPVEILMSNKSNGFREILDTYRIDIIISHHSTFGASISFDKGLPYIYTLHTLYTWFPEDIFSDFKKNIKYITKFIAVSHEVKKFTSYRFNIPEEKIDVIPNGIDIKEFISRPFTKQISRSELGLEKTDYVFIHVASINPLKGHNVLFSALKKLVYEYPWVKVLSVGDILNEDYFGFLKDEIESQKISENFIFLGFVEDIRPYFKISDAFILTSFIEGYCLSALEAMSFKLPLILTDTGNARELLEGSGGGLLVRNAYENVLHLNFSSIDELSKEKVPINRDDLYKAMKCFVQQREFWKKEGEKNYKKAFDFSIERMIHSYHKKLLEIYLDYEKSKEIFLRKEIEEKNEIIRERDELLSKISKDFGKDLLGRLDDRYQTIQKQLDYILVRLSITERLKGFFYRFLKRIHRIVPKLIRERFGEHYKRLFFNKITPADLRQIPKEKSAPLRENGPKDFSSFKGEISRGLPVDLERFSSFHIPDLVSIVLPVYNGGFFIRKAIESILSQTYQNFELIIVNDGSTDETPQILAQYTKHPKITLIEQENQKLPRALSNGFRVAKGEFYTWTSADNLMGESCLELQVKFLKDNPDVQMVYSNYAIIDEEGNPLFGSDYCSGYQTPPGSNHIVLPKDPSDLNIIRNNYIGPCFLYRSW